MSDKWVNDNLKINSIAYDTFAKEYVLITNGQCTLDHSTPEKFKKSHDSNGFGSCIYEPSEGIVARVVGQYKKRHIVGYTHRELDPKHLKETDFKFEDFWYMIHGGRKCKTRYFIGRI